MNKTILGTGIFLGITAILLGAFGAHGLEKSVDLKEIETYQTGVRYQMYHALFLLILACIDKVKPEDKKIVLILICLGVACFSFSLYLLAINRLTDFDFRSIGFVTPIGGILLIAGWLVLAYRVFKQLG